MMTLLDRKNIGKLLNFVLIIVFLLLLFKDPFSERTLIPNFEPYPDTFNYIDPALNLIKGKSFNLSREGRIRVQAVPPLYSFSLMPLFLLKSDPRMAYYANVILSLVSLLFFWLILRRIFVNKSIIFFLLVLYVTNYFIYWVPSIIMAENLTLTLFLISVFLLLSKPVIVNQILLAALAIGLYATKYANISLTFTIIFFSLGKIILEKIVLKQKIKLMLLLLAAVFLFFAVLAVFEGITKGNNIFTQVLEHLSSIERSVPKNNTPSEIISASSWFGIQYVRQNLPLYINSLLGAPNRFLWDHTPLVPKFIAIAGLVGIIGSIFSKKYRFLSQVLLFSLSATVMFMSTFYSFDARYLYIAIPTLLIGFGLFLMGLENKILTKNFFLILLIFVFICIYLISNFTRIKSQISLNLRYAETPWNYVAVLKMNEYFSADKIKSEKKPILISALPPFLIDYYSNGNYTLLPLSYEQEFRGIKETVWGPNDYSDLPKLYRKYLNEGYEVYVSRAGLGNESYTNRDFNTIIAEFDTKLVLRGCYDQCNIYSVKLKENGQ